MTHFKKLDHGTYHLQDQHNLFNMHEEFHKKKYIFVYFDNYKSVTIVNRNHAELKLNDNVMVSKS